MGAYSLTALPITTGVPFVGSPGATISRGLAADGITTDAPKLGDPHLYLGTFNNGVRAVSTFTSELGREWQINIIENGYIGPALNPFEVATPGFTLQYESPNDDLITPIKASKCSMEMIINQTDTALQQLITDISQADDGKFFIYVREDKDLDGNYEPYWWGPIYTDMIKEPDTWPSIIKLVATDNLGRLKDIDYESGGLPITGNKRFTEIIAEILEAGGNGSAIVTHDYIKFSTEWWHNQMGASINNEPMFLSAIRAENYWERDSDTGKYVAPSSYDVLKSILNDWNARIIMTDGYYVIEQATTYSAVNRQEYITDDQGQVTGNALRDTTAQVDQTNIIQLAQGSQDWNKALKEVKRNYLHRYASNILQPQEDYWEATNSATFPYAAVPMNFATAGESKSLQVDGQIELVITNNTGSDYTWSTNHVMVSMRITITNGTTTYYLNKSIWDGESQAQWITSTGGRYDAAIPIGKLADGEQYRKVVNWTIKTPSWTEENMVGTLFYVYYGPTPAIYVALNASGNAMVSANKQDFNVDPYDAAFAGDTVLQGRTKFVFIGLTGGSQNQDGEEIEYIATNSSGTGVNEYEYEQNSKIGSFYKSQIEPGLIRVWDGSQYVTDVGEWEFASIAGAKDFNNLAVQERLRMNKEPRDRKYVTIFGDINAYDHLAYGTGPSTERYVFLGGNFIANNDRWQGVWEKITRATTGVSGTGSSLPSPTGISGIATSPTLPSTPTVAGLTSGLNGQNALATANGTIPKNTSVSNIPVTPFWKSGVINAGNTFSVMDSSGQTQTFVAANHVNAGDTTIPVVPKTTTAPIGPASTIFFSAQQQGTAIANFSALPTTTTSALVITPTSGTISGAGTITEMQFGGLVYCTISWKTNSVSSPSGQVHITGFTNNLTPLGNYYMLIGSGFSSLSDGPIPSIVTSSGLRLLNHQLGSNIGAEFTPGTDIDGTFIFLYSLPIIPISLTANNITTGVPTLASPALTVIIGLIANDITTGAPVLGSPTISLALSLTADDITTAAPTLGSPAISLAFSLTANGITTGVPTLGNPTAAIVPAFLLDTYTGAAAGYSLRRISGVATNSLRVRRSSDNAETDIGFAVDGNLDNAALLAFVGTGGTDNGYVTTWYDQSGNSRHATQTSATAQPQIVSAGNIITVNGYQVIKYDGSNDNLNLNVSGAGRDMLMGGSDASEFYGFSSAIFTYRTLQNQNSTEHPLNESIRVIWGRSLSAAEKTGIETEVTYTDWVWADITNFSGYWSNRFEITDFPLIDTSNGTNFSNAWAYCSRITSFPILDVSNATNLFAAWRNMTGLTSFPVLDTSSCTNFFFSWAFSTGLTSFPALNMNNGTSFYGAWRGCTSLQNFPANMFDSVTGTNFTDAFRDTNLTQTSIDNVLTSIDTANTSNGTFLQSGGSAPSTTGENAIDNLRARGWTVTVTGGY